VLRLFSVVTLLFAGLAGALGQVAPGGPTPSRQTLKGVNPSSAGTTANAVPASVVVSQAPAAAAAADAIAAAPPSTAPPGAPNVVRLQFPNSDVADVLHLYEQLTGKKLVMDNFVQGKVNIFITKDVPREEAIKIIEMNLLMNGFALVPSEGDIVKVLGTQKNPRTTGVPVISDESEIPSGDHVVSFLFKLRYADATELQQVLSQYLQPVQLYTSILALPKASSVLVTENSSVIRSLVRIVDQIDVPPAEVVSEFIKLERADASKVVEMLKDIFEKGQQGVQPGGPGGVRPIRPAPVPQQVSIEGDLSALSALSEDAVVVGKIKITPDVRTNRIHVVTRPVNMPFIRRLIGEFDANVEFAKPVTRPLKYISAAEVLPVLVQALTEPGIEAKGAEGGAVAPGGQQQQQQQRQNRTGTATNPYTGGSSSTGSDSNLNISEELSTTAVDTTPKAVTIGNAKIIADQRANTIIMLGNREIVTKVTKILDEMDVKAPQVALSTVIGELTLHNDEEFGVDYFLKYKNRYVETSRNTSAPLPGSSPGSSTTVTTNPNGTTTTTTSTNAAGITGPTGLVNFGQIIQQIGAGTNVYVAAGNTLAAIVHLLNSTGNFKVISRPMVFTSNNKKAIIASGTEIPVPVSTLSSVVANTGVNGTNIGQQSNIEFKKVALQLEVVPLINSEKEVSLDILQKLDSLAGSQIIDGNSIPTIATRYIRTNVTAPNGGTIILGGLITDSKQKNYTGMPILDRIPLLGYLFRNTSKIKDRTELIVLMRPEVTLTNLDMYRLRVKNEKKTHFGPDLDEEEAITPERGGKELPPPDFPPGK
jgi:type II secretion system protein D